MNLFVDTSIWSMALRRDSAPITPEVSFLQAALQRGDSIVTTGLVLQELLQGFSGPKARKQIIDRFSALPCLVADRRDHIDAAELRNVCRRAGVQIGTVDAILGQLCVRHRLTLLTSDRDFSQMAHHCELKLWV